MFEGFHAAALQASPHGAFRRIERAIDRNQERRVAFLHDDARKPAQDDLDPAYLVDAAARPVHILDSNTDALDGSGELSEPPAELAPDVGTIVRVDIHTERADVRRDRRDIRAPRRPLACFWQ
jgi:hypothetical protein